MNDYQRLLFMICTGPLGIVFAMTFLGMAIAAYLGWRKEQKEKKTHEEHLGMGK